MRRDRSNIGMVVAAFLTGVILTSILGQMFQLALGNIHVAGSLYGNRGALIYDDQ